MNTIEIADQIASQQGLTKAAAKQAVETVMSAIVNAAAQGEEVSLSVPGGRARHLRSRR